MSLAFKWTEGAGDATRPGVASRLVLLLGRGSPTEASVTGRRLLGESQGNNDRKGDPLTRR